MSSGRSNRFTRASSRSRSRSARRRPASVVGTAVQAVVDNVIPIVTGAVANAVGEAATSGFQYLTGTGSSAKSYNPRGKILGTARYKGPFKKGTRKGAKRAGMFTTCHTQEVSGTVTDANCCYLIHGSGNSSVVVRYLCTEMIRKVMARAGFVVHSENETFQSNAANTEGFTLRLFGQNNDSNTNIVVNTYVFGPSVTLNVVTNFFVNAFENYSAGYGLSDSNNAVELTQFCLFDNKTSDSLVATVDLREEVVTLYSKSHLKVQNRTLSGDGTASTDNVNANPLQGYIYNFSGIPKAKPKNMFAFNRMLDGNGVTLIKSADFAATLPELREPPLPRTFWNCYKSGKIRLDPGQIKEGIVAHKLKGNILKILRKIAYETTAGDTFLIRSPFRHQMVALEEVINVDPEESITISYEIDRKLYIKSSTKRIKGTTLGSFETSTYDRL